MNLRIVFKLILYTQAKNVADVVATLMMNLAFTAEVDLVVICLSKTGNLIA